MSDLFGLHRLLVSCGVTIQYDGEYIPNPTDVIYHTLILHLNGVAFYKTGSPVFQCVMTVLDNYIQFIVANGDITRGYDHFMVEMVLFYITNSLKVESKFFWKNVLRYMFKTSLIVNLSPERDSHLREKDVLDIHKQCVILHKKYLLQPKGCCRREIAKDGFFHV